ncbi:hypothetical protein D3C86_1903120 [compost metagenome]
MAEEQADGAKIRESSSLCHAQAKGGAGGLRRGGLQQFERRLQRQHAFRIIQHEGSQADATQHLARIQAEALGNLRVILEGCSPYKRVHLTSSRDVDCLLR